jgi:hypothetical protein
MVVYVGASNRGYLEPGTSYDLDERTTSLITQLQKHFGVTSNAEVIRRAIALAGIASKLADENGKITISSEGKSVTVSLAG